MAAAILPIISAAAPLVVPLIEKLVMGIEHLIQGKGQGPTKATTVINALLPIFDALSTAGIIPGKLDPTSIAAMVENVVQSLKSQGILNPQVAAQVHSQPILSSAPSSGTFKISGGSLTLSFGQ